MSLFVSEASPPPLILFRTVVFGALAAGATDRPRHDARLDVHCSLGGSFMDRLHGAPWASRPELDGRAARGHSLQNLSQRGTPGVGS